MSAEVPEALPSPVPPVKVEQSDPLPEPPQLEEQAEINNPKVELADNSTNESQSVEIKKKQSEEPNQLPRLVPPTGFPLPPPPPGFPHGFLPPPPPPHFRPRFTADGKPIPFPFPPPPPGVMLPPPPGFIVPGHQPRPPVMIVKERKSSTVRSRSSGGSSTKRKTSRRRKKPDNTLDTSNSACSASSSASSSRSASSLHAPCLPNLPPLSEVKFEDYLPRIAMTDGRTVIASHREGKVDLESGTLSKASRKRKLLFANTGDRCPMKRVRKDPRISVELFERSVKKHTEDPLSRIKRAQRAEEEFLRIQDCLDQVRSEETAELRALAAQEARKAARSALERELQLWKERIKEEETDDSGVIVEDIQERNTLFDQVWSSVDDCVVDYQLTDLQKANPELFGKHSQSTTVQMEELPFDPSVFRRMKPTDFVKVG